MQHHSACAQWQGTKGHGCAHGWGTLSSRLEGPPTKASPIKCTHSSPFRLTANPIQLHIWTTTLSACGLNQIHPGTHQVQKNMCTSAHEGQKTGLWCLLPASLGDFTPSLQPQPDTPRYPSGPESSCILPSLEAGIHKPHFF